MKFTRTLIASCNKGDTPSVLYHLAKGANVNGSDSRGWFPLGGAVYGQHEEVVKLLIEFGADINQESNCRWTPLYIAAWKGYGDIAKILLKCGAQTKTKTIADYNSPNGYTALHIAAEQGYCDVVKTLLKFGAEVNPRDGDGYTPLDRAAQNRQRVVEKCLKKRGGKHSKK
jgi:ankyrin repeat protein